MKRIIRAHKIHHKKMTKEECEAFGFLYAPKKYDA
jgi:beta-carotene 3-hydroxylase